jgi:hypothetical protein
MLAGSPPPAPIPVRVPPLIRPYPSRLNILHMNPLASLSGQYLRLFNREKNIEEVEWEILALLVMNK